MDKVRLGVNIDHVATLRQQREEDYPNIQKAAEQVIMAGADQITLHLREDRRHIQDRDVFEVQKVTQRYGIDLNLEMGCDPGIIEIAKKLNPEWFCLVPEKREEKTTEGGLDLEKQFEIIQKTCKELKNACPKSCISLFVEADLKVMEKVKQLPVDAVEIHTGAFAIAVNQKAPSSKFLEQYKQCATALSGSGVYFHAGHGLTDESLKLLVKENIFREYNIGHWIIAESVFKGIQRVVEDLIEIIQDK